MQRTIFDVEPAGEEWVLRQSSGEVVQRFRTRDEAVESGRAECRKNMPSRLRVHSKASE